jgi:hypothetical protein
LNRLKLLGPVRRIVGGIEFYRDAPRFASQTPPLPLDHHLAQRFCHPIQRLRPEWHLLKEKHLN